MGNVTFLLSIGSSVMSLAFDTGPGNALIDWAAQWATNGQAMYDQNGAPAQ